MIKASLSADELCPWLMRKGKGQLYPDGVAGSHLIRTCPVPEQPDETRLANPNAAG